MVESTAGAARRSRWTVVYGVLAVAGAAFPLFQFVPWLMINGLDLPLFFAELFANRISAFFAWDVLISAVVVLLFANDGTLTLGERLAVMAATLFVGVSFGLPILLLLRARR